MDEGILLQWDKAAEHRQVGRQGNQEKRENTVSSRPWMKDKVRS